MLPKTLFVQEETHNIIINESMEDYEKTEVSKGTSQLAVAFNEEKNETIRALELYPVGIALGTYIIAENTEGVYLIDQHAAVERINYEDVLKGMNTKSTHTLLIPITLEFAPSEIEIIKEKKSILEDMGFIIEEFGINTYKVSGHPVWIKEGREADTIRIVFDVLIEENSFDPVKFNDKVAATIACKKSLKGNTRITLDMAHVILKNLVLCDNPYNCPHGRPTIIKFTIYELEKMFKRAM